LKEKRKKEKKKKKWRAGLPVEIEGSGMITIQWN